MYIQLKALLAGILLSTACGLRIIILMAENRMKINDLATKRFVMAMLFDLIREYNH